MTCNPERLSHYLDGELSPDEVEQLQAHLAECDRCSTALDAYRKVDGSLGRLEPDRPPAELRRGLYRQIEQRRRNRARWGWAAPLLYPLIPVTLAGGLAVASLALWRTTRVGAPPVMTAAFAVQEMPESLDGLRLELVFDRPVAAESLAGAITVAPPLPLTQRVYENRVELLPKSGVPLGGAYRLLVANVRDRHGNAQTQPVQLTLSAGPVATIVQESSPPDSASVALTPPRRVIQPADRSPDAPPPPSGVGGPLGGGPGAPGPVRGGPSTLVGPGPSGSIVTLSPGQVEAVGVPPLPGGADPDPGPSDHPLVGALDAAPGLQDRLGLPTSSERVIQLGEQAFQSGAMLSRSDLNLVYVLVRSTNRWTSAPNTFRPGDVLAPVGERPPGTLEPLRAFGKVWRDQPAVKLELGWPVYEERRTPGTIQAFQNGLLLRSSFGVIYAVLNDGTWRTLTEPRR
jgi:putative zinc finger protein